MAIESIQGLEGQVLQWTCFAMDKRCQHPQMLKSKAGFQWQSVYVPGKNWKWSYLWVNTLWSPHPHCTGTIAEEIKPVPPPEPYQPVQVLHSSGGCGLREHSSSPLMYLIPHISQTPEQMFAVCHLCQSICDAGCKLGYTRYR